MHGLSANHLCASLQAAERVRVLEQQAATLQQQQAAALDQQARQRQQLAAHAQQCSQLEGELEAAGRLLQQAERDGSAQAEEQVTVPASPERCRQAAAARRSRNQAART